MGDDIDLGDLSGEDVAGVGPVPQDAMDEAQSDWDAYNRSDPNYQDQMDTIADGSADLDSAPWAANLQLTDSFNADQDSDTLCCVCAITNASNQPALRADTEHTQLRDLNWDGVTPRARRRRVLVVTSPLVKTKLYIPKGRPGPRHAGGDHDRIRDLQRPLFTVYEHPIQHTCRSRELLRQRFARRVTEDLLVQPGLDGDPVPVGLE